MKKLAFCLTTALILLSMIPTTLKAETEPIKASITLGTPADNSVATAQLARLEEIKAMNLSLMSSSEKKELRKEVRAIKVDQDNRRRYQDDNDSRSNNRRHGGGAVVYVGGTGLIIILLLIILL